MEIFLWHKKFISIFPIYIFLYLLSIIYCYIKIPVKFYPSKIFNETEPSTILSNIIFNKLYASIEVGTPKQQIQLPIEFESNDFYISQYDEIYNDTYFKKFKLKSYRENSSKSFKYVDKSEEIYYGTNFFLASIAKDTFYFGEEKSDIEFYLATRLTNSLTGEIGMQIQPLDDLNTAFSTEEKTFFKKIKKSGLINNYIWSIIFDDSNEHDGYLYIGDYLHNINEFVSKQNFNYNFDSLSSTNAITSQQLVKTQFEMNKLNIMIGEHDLVKDLEIGKNILKVKLEYNLGGIIGSEILRSYLETNVFTKENNCYKDILQYRNKYYFYYCNKESNQRIKNIIPKIIFINQDFNYNFTIDAEDIFIEKNGYIFCLIIFDDFKRYQWTLGKPFLKKYHFMIEQDAKKIYFYSKKDEIVIPGMKKNFLYFVVILLSAIFLVLGIILGRKIYRINSVKPINVLDDDFDYFTPQKTETKMIEMSNHLFK